MDKPAFISPNGSRRREKIRRLAERDANPFTLFDAELRRRGAEQSDAELYLEHRTALTNPVPWTPWGRKSGKTAEAGVTSARAGDVRVLANLPRYLLFGAAALGLAAVTQAAFPSEFEAMLRPAVGFIGQVARPNLTSEIRQLQTCSYHAVVVSNDDRIVAFHRIGQAGCGDATVIRSVQSIDEETNTDVVTMLSSGEGPVTAADGAFLGLSPKDIYAVPLRAIRNGLERGYVDGGGASTPLAQAVRSIHGQGAARGDVVAKVANFLETMLFSASISAAEQNRLIVESIPVVIGASGSQFGGDLSISAAFPLLFGNTMQESADWQRCLISAAVKWQIRATGEGTPTDARQDAAAAFERTKHRAKVVFCEDDAEAQALIDAYTLDFSTLGRTLRGSFPGANFFIEQQLTDMVGRSVAPSAVRLTVSSTQVAFSDQLTIQLLGIEGLLPADSCIISCLTGTDPNRADFMISVTEVDEARSDVRLAFANSYSATAGFEGHPGAREHTTRSQGSLNKVPLALDLARSGTRALCNRRYAVNGHWLQNPPSPYPTYGSEVCADAGSVSAAEAFRYSLNLPLIDYVEGKGDKEIADLYEGLGYDIHVANGAMLSASGVVLGYTLTTSTANLARIFAAMSNAINGFEASAPFPRLIDSEWPTTEAPLSLQEFLPTRQSRVRLIALLGAPLRLPEGTLSALTPILAERGCVEELGKTGSTDSAVAGAVAEKAFVASFSCGTRRFVVSVMLRSSPTTHSIGAVKTHDLAELVGVALEHLDLEGQSQ